MVSSTMVKAQTRARDRVGEDICDVFNLILGQRSFEQCKIYVQLSTRLLLPAVERKTDVKGGGPATIQNSCLKACFECWMNEFDTKYSGECQRCKSTRTRPLHVAVE